MAVTERPQIENANVIYGCASGWGRVFRARQRVWQTLDAGAASKVVKAEQKLVACGNGRSFGDASLNHGYAVLQCRSMPTEPPVVDASTGLLSASAFHTQREVLLRTCSRGWALPAIPGSREITLGGMLAADAHGKNHYAAGSTMKHVRSMQVLLADGSVHDCSPQNNADLFWATAGGLGLTGVVLSLHMQARKIASTSIYSDMVGFNSVDELMAVIEAHKDTHEYLLGWANGRFKPGWPFAGAVAVSNHVDAAELPDPWTFPDLRVFRLPFPNFLPGAGWQAAEAINWAIAHKFRPGESEIKNVNQFFFPQDVIANWNVAFGFKGFVEYHGCIPMSSSRAALTEIHDFLCRERILCSLVALKRFGAALPQAPLSFPLDGYSIALDMPVRAKLLEKLKTLDKIFLQHGGRVNPIKDSRLGPDMLRKMYPRVDEWLAIKRKYDPQRKFSSNMSRRLELDG